jgi:hypothetical protein
MYALSRTAVIVSGGRDIPEPEEEISLFLDAPDAERAQATVQQCPMLMTVDPEIYEKCAKFLSDWGVILYDRLLSLAVRKLTAKDIVAAAQYPMGLSGHLALGALDEQVNQLSTGEQQMMQECVVTKTEELLPDHWCFDKQRFK